MEDFLSSSITVPLRASDFDWSKYVHNSKYLQFFEQGRWDWAIQNELDLVHSDVVGVVAKINVNYVKPIYWDPTKDIYVETRSSKISHFSIRLSQKIFDASDLYTTAEVQLALFDTVDKQIKKISFITQRG